MEKTELVNELYRVFSRYTFKPDFLGRCSTTNPPSYEEIKVLGKPLKELSEDDLGRLPLSVMTTWGDEEDFKYFLPRIAELSVVSAEHNIFDYAFFPRIKDVDLAQWQEDERELVYALLTHYIKISIEAFTQGENFTDYLGDVISIIGVEGFKTALREDYLGNAAFFVAAQRLNGAQEIKELGEETVEGLESWFLSSEGSNILLNGLNRTDNEVINYTIQTALNTTQN